MAPEPEVTIRRASEIDAAELTMLHVRAWQWAYRGLLPDAYLDALSTTIEQRMAWRRTMLSDVSPEERTWVATSAGQILGFADTGPCRDTDAPPGAAELYAIYLDRSVVGRGIGRALLEHAVADLRERGYPIVTLWVLTHNRRARRFYEAAGWRPDGVTKVEQWPGFAVDEVRYRLLLAP